MNDSKMFLVIPTHCLLWSFICLFLSSNPLVSPKKSGQLYPNLGQQQQQQIALRPSGVSAAQITQDDLDRVWKPIFENYHGGEGCCEGCTTRRLRIPLSSLKDLLATLPTDDAEKQQQSQLQMSRRNQSRFAHIERSGGGHIPMPRWVLELVTKQADVDRDGWVDYDEFCDIILQNKQDLTSTHLTGLEKVSCELAIFEVWLWLYQLTRDCSTALYHPQSVTLYDNQ